ncbi:terminase small subunit [Lactiplantibacillus argentoratensis]|uniref:terminase small subunit n=1 Tax=Lactiplantibacillus argentoratensis TaxID=271881 RepID=UPI0030CF2518
MKRKLTPKQQKFADEYIKSGNAADAARKAGYSKQTARTVGQQNLTKLDIKKYIDERMAEIASKRIMDAREAVELLTRIARGEEKETVISSTPEGVYESQKEADLKTRISAVKEILKRYPGDDKLVKAQIRKANADARIVEHKANELEGVGHVNPLLKALTKGAAQLVPKEEENDANTIE